MGGLFCVLPQVVPCRGERVTPDPERGGAPVSAITGGDKWPLKLAKNAECYTQPGDSWGSQEVIPQGSIANMHGEMPTHF